MEIKASKTWQWVALTLVLTLGTLAVLFSLLASIIRIQESPFFFWGAIVFSFAMLIVIGLLFKDRFTRSTILAIDATTLSYRSPISNFVVDIEKIRFIQQDDITGTWTIAVHGLWYARTIPSMFELNPILIEFKERLSLREI